MYALILPLLQSPSLYENQDDTVKAVVNVISTLPFDCRLWRTKRILVEWFRFARSWRRPCSASPPFLAIRSMISSCSVFPTSPSPTSHRLSFPATSTSSLPYMPPFPSILGRGQNRGYFRPHRLSLLHPSRPPLPRDLSSRLQPQQQIPSLLRPAQNRPDFRLVASHDAHGVYDQRRGESLVHAAVCGRGAGGLGVGGVSSECRWVRGGEEPAGGTSGHGWRRQRRVGGSLGAAGGAGRAEGARVARESPPLSGAAAVLSEW